MIVIRRCIFCEQPVRSNNTKTIEMCRNQPGINDESRDWRDLTEVALPFAVEIDTGLMVNTIRTALRLLSANQVDPFELKYA